MFTLRLLSRLSLIAGLSLSSPAFSHEFWIEPQVFQLTSGAELIANLRNGQNFDGVGYAYFKNSFSRFELAQGDQHIPVEGRAGDSPALKTTAPKDGLLVILHEKTPSTLKYKEWGKFTAFAQHKDFPNAAADHVAAGWPKSGFSESYTRHAKALVAVGHGRGQDQSYGLKTEFVALTNPYAADFDQNMKIKLLFNNKIRADAQVEIFDRAPDGSVTVTLTHTDTQGVASLPVIAGHTYLLDAVVLQPFKGEGTSVWQTFWAALTFAVPKE